jgi:hypothetical protein
MMQISLAWTVVESLVITQMKLESTLSLIADSSPVVREQRCLPSRSKAVQEFPYFPVDNKKYCYNKDAKERGTVPSKATFLYDNAAWSSIFVLHKVE